MNADWMPMAILATLISIFVGIVAIIKFLFDLKKELTDFKLENQKEHEAMRAENQKEHAAIRADFKQEIADFRLENSEDHAKIRMDIMKLDGRYEVLETKQIKAEKQAADTKENITTQIADIKTTIKTGAEQTNVRLQHVENETSGIIKDMMQYFSNLLKKPPVL